MGIAGEAFVTPKGGRIVFDPPLARCDWNRERYTYTMEARMNQQAYADKWRRQARLQHLLDTLMPPIEKPMKLKQVLRTSVSVYALDLAEKSRGYLSGRKVSYG